jgi:uncharacterized protein
MTRLRSVIGDIGPVVVAVSGGVDSMTLAVVAQEVLQDDARMLHARSPAVPAEASERVRRYTQRLGWRLRVVDAGELADPSYIANPHNRCFYCKTNLYATMAGLFDCVLVSGTNTDDLGDYRPGLEAAARHGVRHPFVEAGMDKAAVRAVARELALTDLAELPASPCLSSRVETGIPIDPDVLVAIDRAERLVRRELGPQTVRCRVRDEAIVIELDQQCLAAMGGSTAGQLQREVGRLLAAAGVAHPVTFAGYRMGSAFLRPADESLLGPHP